ncbi:MAG TPA: hypothetical protein VJ783_10935 [Pirellulales bacterium]|nr:hypothetical protein [Pirellulales bacterium]
MSKNDKKRTSSAGWRPIGIRARRYFLKELRNARLAAQQDGEQFDELLFVFERIGCYRLKKACSLGTYKAPLLSLASESDLGRHPLADSQHFFHSAKDALYELVREARNDALHQGARARHLTQHAIEFGLLLEDALMNGNQPMQRTSDFMVREVTTAEDLWPISFVRETMLTNSFTYLPWYWHGDWWLISTAAVAQFLRSAQANNDKRADRLGRTLEEIRVGADDPAKQCENDVELPLGKPPFVYAREDVKVAVEKFDEREVLLVMKTETAAGADGPRKRCDLVGILTAYDIL